MEDVELLMVGRHFRLGEKLKLIIGRRFRENVALERFVRGRIRMEAPDAKGPVGIIDECVPDPRQETLCGSILARYTDARNENSVKIALSFPDGSGKTIEVTPLRDDDLLGKYNI